MRCWLQTPGEAVVPIDFALQRVEQLPDILHLATSVFYDGSVLARSLLFLMASCGFRTGGAFVGPSAEGPVDAPTPMPDVAVAIDARPDAPPDAPPDAFGAVAYVQGGSSDPATAATTVVVAYPGAQLAGHTNIVAIGWLDSGNAVVSVNDSAGNTYTPLAHLVNTVGQDVYYSNGIAASASNSVTITMSGPATYLDLRVAEYSGLAAANPVDQNITTTAVGTAVDSGSTPATTYWHELLVSASTVQFSQTAGDPAYTVRLLTPNDGNILQDHEVTAVGAYHATATQSTSGAWVTTLLALRAAN